MKLGTASILSVFLLTGCVTAPERQNDPFAGLEITSGQYRDLTLALIISKNTENTIDYVARFDKMVSSPLATGSKAAGDDFLRPVVDIFRRQFRSVVKVDAASDPRARAADLVAVLDVYAEFPNHLFAKARYSVDAHFVDRAGVPIAAVKGESTHAPTETPGFVMATRAKWAIQLVLREAPERFEKDLISSAELQDLARTRLAALQPGPLARARGPAPVDRTADSIQPARLFSDIDTPSYRSQPRNDDFALVVGIEDYSNVPPAQFAERDARTVVAHLEAMGLPRRNIIHLSGSKAVRTGLEKYLEAWLPRNVGETSRVFFYFSGHGAPDPVSGDAYLLPWDGDAEFLKRTGYPITRLYEKLDALKAREVIVALDACFSGAGGRSVLAAGTRPLVMTVSRKSVPRDLTVFTATGDNQITGTLHDQGHGIFTYYFLKGLSGEAADASGRVSARALFDYLDPRVQDAARRQNRDQGPLLLTASDIVLR